MAKLYGFCLITVYIPCPCHPYIKSLPTLWYRHGLSFIRMSWAGYLLCLPEVHVNVLGCAFTGSKFEPGSFLLPVMFTLMLMAHSLCRCSIFMWYLTLLSIRHFAVPSVWSQVEGRTVCWMVLQIGLKIVNETPIGIWLICKTIRNFRFDLAM